MTAVWVLLVCLTGIVVAHSAQSANHQAVRLTDVKTLVLQVGVKAQSRRSSLIFYQLNCVDGCAKYTPASVLCKNEGKVESGKWKVKSRHSL